MQEKLHQWKRKQSKGAKICASIWWELEREKCSKTVCKIFRRQNIQNQNNIKYFSNSEDICNPHMNKMGPWGPKHYIFGDHFCSKNTRKLRFMYSSILLLGNIWYYHFTWSGPNSQEIVNLFQFSNLVWVPGGPTIGTKFTISCKFGPLQVKWWCHVFYMK